MSYTYWLNGKQQASTKINDLYLLPKWCTVSSLITGAAITSKLTAFSQMGIRRQELQLWFYTSCGPKSETLQHTNQSMLHACSVSVLRVESPPGIALIVRCVIDGPPHVLHERLGRTRRELTISRGRRVSHGCRIGCWCSCWCECCHVP